ncbi:MAG: molybdopterin-dependent oxidoreductase, partial [Actinomycetota bacterium]|nr:molybdopterin-dependent oxidoreductase [Actinomycetota bacterium]
RPMVRDGGELRPVSWDRALSEAASALARARGRVGAIAGGQTTNEEGFLLQRLMREALESPHVDSSPLGSRPRADLVALANPRLAASVSDVEFAHTVLVLDCEPIDDAPILDLRIRKGVRRRRTKLAVATSRPSALDPNAIATHRFAPGGGAEFARALARGDHPEFMEALRAAGEEVVILVGERSAPAALELAEALGLADVSGGGILEIPAGTNGRGLREAGCVPGSGPGYAEAPGGCSTPQIAEALVGGDLAAVYLMHVDPIRDLPGRATWEAGLERASTVIAHAAFLTDGLREHATVVFPAEGHPEKEGTITHPDGRLQRVRPAIAHQGENRPEWQVLADLCQELGAETGVLTAGMAFQQLVEAVPFYAGLTLDVIGGRGVRWPERAQATSLPALASGDGEAPEGAASGPAVGPASPSVAAPHNGHLRLGTFRSIWASPEVEHAPALKFLAARQRAELSPDDAKRLGLRNGERVEVGANGTRVNAIVALRHDVPAGTVFLEEGVAEDSANVLSGEQLVEVRRS